MNPFLCEGFWVKGNLHSHTNNSDGVLSPDMVVEYYRKYGFDFIALTDHDKITCVDSNGIILFPGIEIAFKGGFLGGSYHIVGINVYDEEYIHKLKDESIQNLIDYFSGVGLALIAHPYWSNLTSNDLFSIKNYFGIEIYNTGCDVEVAKGYSNIYWDNLLARDTNVYGVAVDDAHWYNNFDAPGGWILVKVRERSMDEIIDSIKIGAFYSTMGPTIKELNYKDNVLEARFTPVKRVDIISENGTGFSFSLELYKLMENGVKNVKNLGKIHLNEKHDCKEVVAENGNRMVKIELTENGIIGIFMEGFKFKNYIRLEITDMNSKRAWSNPIPI